LREGLAAGELKALKVRQAACDGSTDPGRKTNADEAMVAITGRANLACRGATNDLNADKQSIYFFRQRIEIVGAGTKENNQCHVGLLEAAVQFPGGLTRVASTGMSALDRWIGRHECSLHCPLVAG
jgi:hypothetical protein